VKGDFLCPGLIDGHVHIESSMVTIPEFAREHGLVSIIDNTFASPINYRPPEWGYDLSLHSATKFLGGHADALGGVLCGRADLMRGG
jgi:cystathionine beta-lyase/cystathionine gamma-synthase